MLARLALIGEEDQLAKAKKRIDRCGAFSVDVARLENPENDSALLTQFFSSVLRRTEERCRLRAPPKHRSLIHGVRPTGRRTGRGVAHVQVGNQRFHVSGRG